jgi:hypothetical protein
MALSGRIGYDKVGGMSKETVITARYYPSICQDGIRPTMRKLSQG